MKVCPLPQAWDNIYKEQVRFYNKYLSLGENFIHHPPVPLNLNGWVYSNDNEKYERWNESILWSILYLNNISLIHNLKDSDYYYSELNNNELFKKDDVELIYNYGFSNFCRFEKLMDSGCSSITTDSGVYIVFIPIGLGVNINDETTAISMHKGRNLLYDKQMLESKINRNSRILYIGKANNLRNRIRQYVRYGYGLCDNHRGGRAIWQLNNNKSLLIGYTKYRNPRGIEIELLLEYEKIHNTLPFANFKY